MVEVIIRSPKGKTHAPKAVPATQQPQAPEAEPISPKQPDWFALSLPHIRKLSDLLFNLVDRSEHDAPELIQGLVVEATDITTGLWSVMPEGEDVRSSVWRDLNTVVLMLRAAMRITEHKPPSAVPAIHVRILPEAIDFANSIVDAVHDVPNLQRMHVLNDCVSRG